MHLLSGQQAARQGTAGAGEDRARQGYASALAHHAASCQETGCHALLAARGRAHQRAVVRRLEHGLSHARED